MYTIKEVAAEVGESEHTIRYYCKEGLFPFLVRDQNNVRKFSEADLEGVRIVLCLRDNGMSLSEIRRYMELCAEGVSTLNERLEIIRQQKENAYRQLAEFQKKIDHLEWKEQHYVELLQTGEQDDCNPIQHKDMGFFPYFAFAFCVKNSGFPNSRCKSCTAIRCACTGTNRLA